MWQVNFKRHFQPNDCPADATENDEYINIKSIRITLINMHWYFVILWAQTERHCWLSSQNFWFPGLKEADNLKI